MPEPKIPLIICEFHQEVLEYIHRYIAQKHLPFNGIKMIHFDSHPDLAFPDHLSADDCFIKEKLYTELDIADWLLPLMYAGHLKSLVWMKPPWANQIADMCSDVTVGKERDSGKLRIDCKEDYFLEDGTYAPVDCMINTHPVRLAACSIGNEFFDRLFKMTYTEQAMEPDDEPKQKRSKLDRCYDSSKEQTCSNDRGDVYDRTKLSNRMMNVFPKPNEKYILDIDLDYFSVTNPFLKDYTKDEYERLRNIYKIEAPSQRDDEDRLMSYVRSTREKIEKLKNIITKFSENDCVLTNENDNFIHVLNDIKNRKNDEMIDWSLVHNAGLSTELPHHVTSERQLEDLLTDLKILLQKLPPPALITIARSALDEYCPSDQVDMIQTRVMDILQNIYKNTDVIFDYKDTSRILTDEKI